MDKQINRQDLFKILTKYWWILFVVVVIGFVLLGIPILTYLFYAVGVIIVLLIFGPWLFQLFGPALYLISGLAEHFRESKGQSIGKRFILIPAALVSAIGFITAQSILSIWITIVSIVIWANVIGIFFTFLLMFFFAAAPLAIITAPFVVWIKAGFSEFFSTGIFFLLAFFWYGFSKLAFPENNFKATAEDYLGYSPQIFLLGALSFQVIALPFYYYGLLNIGNTISDTSGFFFLIFAVIAAFKLKSVKKKLPDDEKENLYRPSVWVYLLGFFTTNLLNLLFHTYSAPTAILNWLNLYFLVVLILRFFGLFKRKKIKTLQDPTKLEY